MLQYIERVGSWAPIVVLLAAYAETAAFLGLIVPGETLMFAGGAAAAIGGVNVGLVVAMGIVGAASGDATGYYLGRRYGATLLDRPTFQRFSQPVAKAGDFLEQNGWWALILARFLAMFRAVVPFAAGAARMPYARFAVGNVVGSILYGGLLTGIGYWAGSNWEQIEGVVQRGGLTLGAFVGSVSVIALGTRWVSRHKAVVERALAKWRRYPVIGVVLGLGVTRTGRARPFLAVLPPIALGLGLLSGFALAGLIDWSRGEAAVIRHIQAADHVVVELATAVRDAAIHPVVIAALIVAAVVQAASIGWRPTALLVVSVLVTLFLTSIFNDHIHRPFGPLDLELALEPNFPDAAMAVGSAAVASLAWPWRASWTAGAVRLGSAAALTVALAVARAVTVSAYPVDVVAGLCLGVATVLAAGLIFDRRLRRKLKTEPHSHATALEMPAATSPAPERPPI